LGKKEQIATSAQAAGVSHFRPLRPFNLLFFCAAAVKAPAAQNFSKSVSALSGTLLAMV
jgi:hypothetical protein